MKRTFSSIGFALTVGACGGGDPAPTGSQTQAVTYWNDVLPVLERHCLGCHQEGGIGPFRLDEYATAKARASAMRDQTANRTMPPWAATSDGTCGQFADSLALSAAQIATIARWVEAGTPEGTPRAVNLPPRPGLEGATDFTTPTFAPIAGGGTLDLFDEYRCFAVDSSVTDPRFITGYEVVPGTSEIVHHVIAYVVAPQGPAQVQGKTNAQVMEELHAQSPGRDGWPCFGAAGEGIAVSSVPVVWAPGQGALTYPNASGVPLGPQDKVVIQVHYNLAEPANKGKTDQTKIKLRLDAQVPNVGLFILADPLLDTIADPMPTTLEPGRESVKYTWRRTVAELGFGDVPNLELYGAFPHMHELGHKYQLKVDADGNGDRCAVNVEKWNFHWQRMYFYSAPYALSPRSSLEVTCDYDTSSKKQPIFPGWGTRNEMCTGIFYLTAPIPPP